MRNVILTVIISFLTIFANATEVRVPASTSGTLCDLLKGKKLALAAGINISETAANIATAMHCWKPTSTEESFVTEAGDYFLFSETSIKLVRNNVVLSTYNIENGVAKASLMPQTYQHLVCMNLCDCDVAVDNTFTTLKETNSLPEIAPAKAETSTASPSKNALGLGQTRRYSESVEYPEFSPVDEPVCEILAREGNLFRIYFGDTLDVDAKISQLWPTQTVNRDAWREPLTLLWQAAKDNGLINHQSPGAMILRGVLLCDSLRNFRMREFADRYEIDRQLNPCATNGTVVIYKNGDVSLIQYPKGGGIANRKEVYKYTQQEINPVYEKETEELVQLPKKKKRLRQ